MLTVALIKPTEHLLTNEVSGELHR